MQRIIGSLGLIGLLFLTFKRDAPREFDREFNMQVASVPLPPARELDRLGPFRLEKVWHFRTTSMRVGGYSALLSKGQGRWIALSDRGYALRFTPPDRPGKGPESIRLELGRYKRINFSDVESATRDPATGMIWLGMEGRNQIVRLNPDLVMSAVTSPPEMQDWGSNSGPESLVRLADGRFLTIREVQARFLAGTGNPGLLFPGDPTVEQGTPLHFTIDGPHNFSVTDMTQMPDGRVLILMRRLIWPMPMRFAARIAIGDPRRIRDGGVWHVQEVARLSSTMSTVDNMEGIAVEPRKDGRLGVWLISDDNHGGYQRTLLWRMSVDPARLPWPK